MRKTFSLTLAFALVFGLAVTLPAPSVADEPLFDEAPQSVAPDAFWLENGETVPFWLFPSDFATCTASCGDGRTCGASGPGVSCQDGVGCAASDGEVTIGVLC